MAGLHAALGESRAEIVFVDDSDDSTPQVAAEVATESARPIRLIHRRAGKRAGGLGSAVVQGLRAAAGAVSFLGQSQSANEMNSV